MNFSIKLSAFLISSAFSVSIFAGEAPPKLPATIKAETLTSNGEQQKVPDLAVPYVSTSPTDLHDGLAVGHFDMEGSKEAVAALLADDKKGKYLNLDSLLIWKDGKLIFEMYNRMGRVDAPHYLMSVTKTMVSVTLGRAIQKGLLTIADLDKPVVDFMPELDRSKIQQGVDTITLRDALYMKTGLRFGKQNIKEVGETHQKQAYFQQLFEMTEPITPESKQYKYTGTSPALVLMVLDIKTGGKVKEFIKNEVIDKLELSAAWADRPYGLPAGGAATSFTSRSMMKVGTAVIQGGMYQGEQWLSPEYVKLIMDTSKGQGYFYFFHNRSKFKEGAEVNFISGNGAGGQYMSTYPDQNMVIVATSHNKKGIGKPLDAIGDHLFKLLEK